MAYPSEIYMLADIAGEQDQRAKRSAGSLIVVEGGRRWSGIGRLIAGPEVRGIVLRASVAEMFAKYRGFEPVLFAQARRGLDYFEDLVGKTRQEVFAGSGASVRLRVAFCRKLAEFGFTFEGTLSPAVQPTRLAAEAAGH